MNDSGPGSIRQAILDANAAAGPDTIAFAIGVSAPQTITVLSQLPDVQGPTTIDGNTQTGSFGPPAIELRGGGAVPIGLAITGGNSTIRGLIVNGFTSTGIALLTNGGNVLHNNYVGTNVSGALAVGNGNGISVQNGAATIGGVQPGEANVISGNGRAGIQLLNGSGGTVISGNRIGTNAAGDAALGNAWDGIAVGGFTDALIQSNIISGNGTSANDHAGIHFYNSAQPSAVQQNRIGTNAAGTAALLTGTPRSSDGIKVEQLTGGHTIGGPSFSPNVISGNERGIVLLGSGNIIKSNRIGTAADGTTPLPNRDTGILISNVSSGNTIGGTDGADGNAIRHNGAWGIYVFGGINHSIRANSIFGNAALGIDLAPQNVTANDAGDGDSGANNLQNFPVLTVAQKVATGPHIEGTLESTPNTSFGIDYYASPSCDGSGNGEGRDWLGRSVFSTDASGVAVIDTGTGLTAPITVGDYVTATATDPNGSTSEFSACIQVQDATGGGDTTPPDTQITAAPPDYGGATDVQFTFSSTEAEGTFECRLVPDAFAACTTPRQLTGLTADSYSFEVRARDAAGNADASPAVHRFTVDTAPFVGTLDVRNGRVTGTSGGRTVGAAADNQLAQVFTPSATGQLIEARIGLECTTPAAVTVRVEATTSGVPNGTVLATSTVADVSSANAFKRFAFSPAPTLNAGTQYALTLSAPGAPCYAYIAEDATPGAVYFREGGGTWNLNSAPEDLGFATFLQTAPPAGTGPATLVWESQRDGNLELYGLVNGTEVRLTSNAADDARPALSPDGTKVAFHSNRAGGTNQIYVLDLTAGEVVRLTNAPEANDFGPAWSPEGTRLAFARQTAIGQATIVAVDYPGAGNAVSLTAANTGLNTDPAFSPDGTKIAFTSDRTEDTDVFVADLPGGANATNLTTSNAGPDFDPVWSPDATAIAFTSQRGAETWPQLYRMTRAGANAQPLTTQAASGDMSADATWSPDGAHIAYAFSFGGAQNFEIYRINAVDGSGKTRITENGARDGYPSYRMSAPVDPPPPPGFVVTNTADSGAGSLRAAITAANAAPGADTITFAIPVPPYRIVLLSPLPALAGPVTIDGSSQPGFTGAPLIELTAGAAGSPYEGLRLSGDGALVKSLALFGFGNAVVMGGANHRLTGSYVGLTAGGLATGNSNIGVIVEGSGMTIGGADAAAGNVVSASGGNGIVVGNGVAGTQIRNNLVGTNASGLGAAGNAINGVLVNSATNTTIAGNVVSGNRNDGVFSHSTATITGNRIGLGVEGDQVVPNLGDGVQLNGSGATVGGAAAGAANTIVGNSGVGVRVSNGSGNNVHGNAIHSNGALGIDLGTPPGGVTPNDGEDTDTGPNGLQNFPEITRIAYETGSTTHVNLLATLSVGESGSYRIDYFANVTCDGSGNGEGERYLGSDLASAVGPNVSFDSTSFGPVSASDYITATVTGPSGSTSEFSGCVRVGDDLGELGFNSPAECVPGYLGGQTVDFEGAASGSLAERYASLGLHFVDDATTTPIPYSNTAERTTSSGTTSLANDADSLAGSSGVPLTITFDEPQTRVGLFAGNGNGETSAELTAYGTDDVLLGTVETNVANDVVTYLGINIPGGGVRKVTLDYGATSLSEEIDDICFLASEETGESSDALTLTSDQKSVPVGVENAALADVPSNQLPSFAGSPASAPVGSIPVGSIPVGSIPVGSIPVGSIPVGSIPVGSIPVGSIPVGSIPVGSIGLGSIPVGSIGLDQILLSMLPVDADALLRGTPLEDRPRQAITLADVYANSTTRQRFNDLKLPESGLMSSILNGVPFSAFMLGRATLSQLPPPGGASTWCAAITAAGGSCSGVSGSNTVVGLSIAGVPVGSIPVGSIPVGSIPVGSIPVGSIPLREVDLVASRLAGIRIADLNNRDVVVNCGSTCPATLGEARASITAEAQIKHLEGDFPANLVLNDLIMGIVPRSALAWEGFPLDGFQLFAGTGDVVKYRLSFTLPCPAPSPLAARVKLPDGWLYKPGTTRWRFGTGTPVEGAEPDTSSRSGARWTDLPAGACPTGATSRAVELSFDALAGLTLGIREATAAVTLGAQTLSTTPQAPVLVTQNWENNDAFANAPAIAKDRLVVGHVAKAGDVEYFRLPIPAARGTRTTVYLSHIAEGADFDLVIHKPAAPSLLSSPVGSIPVGSIPVEDGGSSVDNRTEALPPDTLQDVPVGSIPVGSISANRGSANEAATVVADGEEGFYTIAVSGYNGSFSDRPFMLRVVQTPPPTIPPCLDRNLTLGAPGTLPPAASGAEALFVINRQRLAALYPSADMNALYTALGQVAALVNGQILEVDGSPAVRNAYAAWDQSPCSIDAANDVVAAINAAIAPYRAAAKHVVLLGTDEALPMMRRLDPVTISNEVDEAPDLLFTLNDGKANALYAAAARGYFLSDTVYGTTTSVPWLGRDLYLPNVAVGRLVETPADIRRQLELYVEEGGMLDPQSTLATAYDFLTDGGQAVAAGLAGVGASHDSLINDSWTASTLLPKLNAPADVLSVNAHYSHWLLQPAAGSALVSTDDLPDVEGAFRGRIQFTMGCHAGLSVADTLKPSSDDRFLDWTQAFAQRRGAVFVANTGFGYGDTVANALSERLMSIFADNLSDQGAIGERWLDAVHEYYGTAGVYGVYDEKALTEATFYGLPFWSLGPETASTAATAGTPPTDPVVGLPVAPVSVAPSLTPRSTSRGSFWDANGETLAVHYRPIQPRVAVDVTRSGLVATGAIIKSLQTTDVGGVNAVHATPTIDLAANEPERRFRELIFPASPVALTRSRTSDGERQHLVVIAGQFRPDPNTPNNGTERLIGQIGLEVAYSPSPADDTPPVVHEVNVVDAGSSTIAVSASEPAAGGVKRVAALYTNGVPGAGGVLNWSFVELQFQQGTGDWRATGLPAGPLQVIAMAQNANGLVAYSANKGVNFPSVVDNREGPEVLVEAPAPESVYLLNQVVPVSFSCSDASGIVATCQGSPLVGGNLDTSRPGENVFTITATDISGNTSTVEIPYTVRYVFQGFFEPVDNVPTLNTGRSGRTYPVKWKLKDAQGAHVRTLAAVRSVSRTSLSSCSDRPQEVTEEGEPVSISSLKYDTVAEQYVYSWKTERTDAGCRRLVIEFADGTRRFADFLLR